MASHLVKHRFDMFPRNETWLAMDLCFPMGKPPIDGNRWDMVGQVLLPSFSHPHLQYLFYLLTEVLELGCLGNWTYDSVGFNRTYRSRWLVLCSFSHPLQWTMICSDRELPVYPSGRFDKAW